MISAILLLLWAGLTGPAAAVVDTAGWGSLPDALEEAGRRDRPVLVYVSAPWCGPCRRMERDVFPAAAPLLGRFALARLGFDDHEGRLTVGAVTRSPADWARHFGAEATPTFVLLDADGAVITRAAGFLDARAFTLLLAYVATGAYRHADFADYARRVGRAP